MTKKKLDLGEYVITVEYDKKTGNLDVRVLDEAGEIIEGILITENNEDDGSIGMDFNLN